MYCYDAKCDVSVLKGKVIAKIDKTDDRIDFHCEDGSHYAMLHDQNCCESVKLEDVCGDLDDLIGAPVTMAEESSNSDDGPKDVYDESYTWTFYRFATAKGYVTIRWYGTSNGYYSESVKFYDVTRIEEDS